MNGATDVSDFDEAQTTLKTAMAEGFRPTALTLDYYLTLEGG